MLAPRASTAAVCAPCGLQRARRPLPACLRRRARAAFCATARAAFSASAHGRHGADEPDALSPLPARGLRITKEAAPLNKIKKTRQGTFVRETSARLGGVKTLGDDADILVLRDVRDSAPAETPADAEAVEPAVVPDILASLQQQLKALTPDDIRHQLEGLRPQMRAGPDEPLYVPLQAFVKLVRDLNRGFTKQQLSHFYSAAKNVRQDSYETELLASLKEGKGSAKRPVMRSSWQPGTSPITRRLPGVDVGTRNKRAQVSKQLLVDRIIRGLWNLVPLEEVEQPGEIELSLKPWQSIMLNAGEDDETLLDRISNARKAKIEVYPQHSILRITADKTTAEYTADDIEEALRNVHSQKLRLNHWAKFLDKAKLPPDNKLVTLYTDDEFRLVTSLTGASVQRMDDANTMVIKGLDRGTVEEAERILVRLLPWTDSALYTIDNDVLAARKDLGHLLPTAHDETSLEYRHRSAALGRWVFPITNKSRVEPSDEQAAISDEATTLTPASHPGPHTLLYDFVPAPQQDGLAAGVTPPNLRIKIQTNRDGTKVTPREMHITFQKQVHTVLLPDRSADLQFNVDAKLSSTQAYRHVPSVQEWVDAVSTNIASGERLSAPNLSLDVPRWIMPHQDAKAKTLQSIMYTFSNLHFRQTLTGEFEGLSTSCYSFQSGKMGPRGVVLGMYYSPNAQSVRSLLQDEKGVASFVEKSLRFVDRITNAANQTQPIAKMLKPRKTQSERKQRRLEQQAAVALEREDFVGELPAVKDDAKADDDVISLLDDAEEESQNQKNSQTGLKAKETDTHDRILAEDAGQSSAVEDNDVMSLLDDAPRTSSASSVPSIPISTSRSILSCALFVRARSLSLVHVDNLHHRLQIVSRKSVRMVSTRQTPRGNFPTFEPSPTKKPLRTSTASPAPTSSPDLHSSTATSFARRAANNAREAVASPPTPAEVGESSWCHTASNLTVLWIAVSIPLVLWDTLYILLRPHTFKGGALQWPIWKPYEIYAAIDKVYSPSAWDAKEGFGGAQGALNAIETILYGLYAMILYHHGIPAAAGTGAQISQGVSAWFAGGIKVRGKVGSRALIIGFAASVMTLSKTVLYYFNEYFSGFVSVKHNDWFTLFLFYGVMNGLWVIFPAYMTVVFGSDILQALDIATDSLSKKTN
ncbi:mitochondrial inner-membrane-bound regulator-domain-containing protein [Ampelomyces quisqualis]|uniref:Mitochondrial inner-membrane-bound regulator-domain-containing protein n=1 Tax=Ampelomyces quisqualis TaxID=50730 RepID=A0A6A5QW56_AMPQU|nr:mitochondrial inner-membrane-bound regulator-domain-containing protein [Ampelomyces quisqualis]